MCEFLDVEVELCGVLLNWFSVMTSDNINGYQSKNFFFFEIFPAQYVSLFMVVLTDSCYRVIADFDATLTMFWVKGLGFRV